MKKLLDELNAMPGPVWVFGAYGVYRLWGWLTGMLPALFSPGSFWPLIMGIGGLLAAILPLALLWLMLRRNPYAVQQVGLYAGLQALARFVSLFFPLFRDIPYFGETLRMQLAGVVWCCLWFGLLYYLERSAVIRELFPEENRRKNYWSALPMIALILVYM